MFRLIFAIIYFCSNYNVASAASFDCSLDKLSKAEKTICGNELLSEKDSKLSNLYQNSINKANSEQKSILKGQQRDWLKNRELCAKSNDSIECLNKIYDQRNHELDNSPNHIETSTNADLKVIPEKITSFKDFLNEDCIKRNPKDLGKIVCKDSKLSKLDNDIYKLNLEIASFHDTSYENKVITAHEEWVKKFGGSFKPNDLSLETAISFWRDDLIFLLNGFKRNELIYKKRALNNVTDWAYILMLSIKSPGGLPSHYKYLAYGETPKQCNDALFSAKEGGLEDEAYKKEGFPVKLICHEVFVNSAEINVLEKIAASEYIPRK